MIENKELRLTDGNGKMENIRSLNTSPLQNSFCCQMANQKGSVCDSCFSLRMISRFGGLKSNMHNTFKINGDLLSESILEREYLPFLPTVSVLRIHSHGELINKAHFINIINIALKNPHLIVSIWTKRKELVRAVLLTMEKPENLILVYSSIKVDDVIEIVPDNFDKVFNVVSQDSKAEINCGDKKCKDCMLCYSHNDVDIIIEKLK